jgi:glutamine amidotransferase
VTSRPTRVAVVDHGAGNLVSVSQALTRCGAEVDVVSRPTQLDSYDGIVLPGVGATRTVMKGIEDGGFTIPLQTTSRPLLGICVGMQVLFDMSEEDDAPCLGIVGGRVRRLESAPSLPHIGWNDLELVGEDPLFEGLADPVVYFVHSYAPTPTHPGVVTAESEHGRRFVAAIRQGNVVGVQFHPERSGSAGLRMLSRFVATCKRSPADVA